MAERTDLRISDILTRDVLGLERDNAEQLAVARQALRDVLCNELTGRQCEIIRMRYYEEMRPIDIARALGLAPSTVTRSLQRSRRTIYRCMRFYFDYRRMQVGDP
ncbi:MAG: sigma-70 family RNA polymerase sigma factor [Oscillospiraceae bacterium]|nr:sigma-70 family RNA polymerase sigma factor [Oscillospiraceae bacterium]